MLKMEYNGSDGPITIQYNNYEDGSKVTTFAPVEQAARLLCSGQRNERCQVYMLNLAV
jgi:hypothetical protein